MTATITRSLGKFVWHELYTPDAEASKRFYQAVFGWNWTDAPMEGFTYRLGDLGGKQICGMMAIADMGPEGAHVPPHWGGYVSVDDVDAAAGRVTARGGKVLMGPADIPGIGRFATIQDPQHGITNLYFSTSGDGDDAEPGVGEFAWESLMTSDPAAAIAFYQHVTGWGTAPMGADPNTILFTRAGGAKQVANVSPANDMPTHWLTYVMVANREATNATIEANGGKVLAPAIDIPGVGFIAMVQDPHGATFCTWQPG